MGKISKIERVAPLREQVADGLMQALRNGRFSPGERLTEERVADVLGVSRTPVREAFGVLAQRGILTGRDGGGFYVSKPSLSSLENVFELRRLLEPYAARLAARRFKSTDLARLRKATAKLRKLVTTGSAALIAEANREVRRVLFGLCGNENLVRAIEQNSDHVYLIGMLTMNSKEIRALVLARHEQILKALVARDERAIERAVTEYLDAAHRSVIAALTPGGDEA
jgi:DNA-binding GntR family transcriptional regulator